MNTLLHLLLSLRENLTRVTVRRVGGYASGFTAGDADRKQEAEARSASEW